MPFASITLPTAARRWRLTGPPGPHTDALVAGLVGAGVSVESIAAGTAYRLDGDPELLDVLADELEKVEGFALALEQAPADTVEMRSAVAPSHPFRRSVSVHGATTAAASFVARAIDRGLQVSTIGINRWSIAGRTAALVDWLAAIYVKPAEEVLALFSFTAETVSEEDSPAPAIAVTLPPLQVAVTLPDRRTTSEIKHNADGDIVQVIQLETTA